MDPVFIKAFVSSVQNVFATMLQMPVTLGAPKLKETPATTFDVSGIIGMSGDVVGSVALSFPTETASRVVSLLSGANVDPASPDFADAIGELVNMVSGGAKAQFTGKKVSISCPSVVSGKGHIVQTPKGTPSVSIPCQTDCGQFSLEVAIRVVEPAAAQAA